MEIEAAGPALYTLFENVLTLDVTSSVVYPIVSPHAKYKPYSSGELAPILQVAHFTDNPKSTYSYPLCVSTFFNKYLTLLSSSTKDTFGAFNTPPI